MKKHSAYVLFLIFFQEKKKGDKGMFRSFFFQRDNFGKKQKTKKKRKKKGKRVSNVAEYDHHKSRKA